MPADRANYPGIPDDFPINETPSAISGVQPKMSLVGEGGKFYAPGTSPAEVSEALQVCEDLVLQMIPYCQRKLAAFGGDEERTLKAVFQGLLGKRWCTAEQSAWVVVKTAQQLGWSIGDETLTPLIKGGPSQ